MPCMLVFLYTPRLVYSVPGSLTAVFPAMPACTSEPMTKTAATLSTSALPPASADPLAPLYSISVYPVHAYPTAATLTPTSGVLWTSVCNYLDIFDLYYVSTKCLRVTLFLLFTLCFYLQALLLCLLPFSSLAFLNLHLCMSSLLGERFCCLMNLTGWLLWCAPLPKDILKLQHEVLSPKPLIIAVKLCQDPKNVCNCPLKHNSSFRSRFSVRDLVPCPATNNCPPGSSCLSTSSLLAAHDQNLCRGPIILLNISWMVISLSFKVFFSICFSH